MKRCALVSFAFLVTAALLPACSKVETPPAASVSEPAEMGSTTSPPPAASAVEEGPVTLDARVNLPAGWTREAIIPSECMTPIDRINDGPAGSPPYSAGQAVSVVGWNVTSSSIDATPETIYGVFKPYNQSQDGALLAGKRVERPDVAGENALYLKAGYELAGNLPISPGRYRFYVWTGSPDAIVECDSKMVLTVQ